MVTVRDYRVEDQEAVVTLWWNSWHSIRTGLRHPQPFAAWRTRWASDIAFNQEVVVADDEGTIVFGLLIARLGGKIPVRRRRTFEASLPGVPRKRGRPFED
jgi:hypothetical protein